MRKLKLLITIFACLFLIGTMCACDEEQNNNQDVPSSGDVQTPEQTPEKTPEKTPSTGSTVDVSKATLTNEELEYTGEPLAIVVKNLPGGVSVDYVYTKDGVEVTEMVEIGEYEVTATIKDKETKEVLTTLTATLTIKEREVVDEIKDDLEASIELTYGTTYKPFSLDPQNNTQLVAAIDIMASETIYFVLAGEDTPLNFFDLDSESIEVAKKVDNTVCISEPGSYDLIMTFPEGSIVPTVLVRASLDDGTLYLRGSMNEYAVLDEYKFVVDEENNTASYEIELAVNDEFTLGSYYYKVQFSYDPYFTFMPVFSAGGAFGTDVKVIVAGTYKFVVDLTNNALTIYKDGEQVIQDREMLYIRGTMNNWDTSTALVKNNGVATIEIELAKDAEFKIADGGWGVQYDYSYFGGVDEFVNGAENGNIKVAVAGKYKFELNLENKTLTVYKDGNKIIDNVSLSGPQAGDSRFQLIINGDKENPIDLFYKGQADVDGVSHEEHFATNVVLNVGDVITLHDTSSGAYWIVSNLNPYSNQNTGNAFEANAAGIKCVVAGTYDVYVQFAMNNDKIYIGPAGA